MKSLPSSIYHKIILVGGGPACISAAIQLKRSNHDVIVISPRIGGIAENANLIENLLGFPKGITGSDFVDRMQDSIQIHQIKVVNDSVNKIFKNENFYSIITDKCTFSCDYLVIGTGTNPKLLEIEQEQEFHQKNFIFYERWIFSQYLLLLPSPQEKKIAIIGSGDAAYDYSLNLSNHVDSIEIIQRTPNSQALQLLQERVKLNHKINILFNRQVKSIKLDNNQVIIENNITDKYKSRLEVRKYDYILVAIGRKPNISFLSDELEAKYNHIINNQNILTKNNKICNIWFIGDMVNNIYRQIAIAMADGLKTAMEINQLLK